MLRTMTTVLMLCLLAMPAPAEDAPAQAEPPVDLAEPPHWPVGFQLSDAATEGWKPRRKSEAAKAEVLVWTPPGAQRLRAVMFIPANSDSKHVGEHAAVRQVAARHGMGIVYLRRFDGSVIERSDPPTQADATFDAVLAQVAQHTGVESYRYAPWVRGRFAFRTTWWFPGRVIASVSYHGETPGYPPEQWAKTGDETPLHLALNGFDEWDRTWYRHVRPMLLNYRHHTGWLPHQAALPGVGHGNYADMHGSPGWGKPVPEGVVSTLDSWDYIALFLDKALTLRLPEGEAGYATADTPVKLNDVGPGTGLLIHPRAIEELAGAKWRPLRKNDEGRYTIVDHVKEPGEVFAAEDGDLDPALLIRKHNDVPEAERADYLWIADRELAEAWVELHTVRAAHE